MEIEAYLKDNSLVYECPDCCSEIIVSDKDKEADSLEEAIYIMCNEDVEGDWSDQDFDIDVHETLESVLRSHYD